MSKLTRLEHSKDNQQLPEQSSLAESSSSHLKTLSLNGGKASATFYGHPLGPHMLAPADNKQVETISNMEADARGLGNAQQTSSAGELRSSQSTQASSEVCLHNSPQNWP